MLVDVIVVDESDGLKFLQKRFGQLFNQLPGGAADSNALETGNAVSLPTDKDILDRLRIGHKLGVDEDDALELPHAHL